jgi:enoyl-CoA hydratase
MASESVVVEQLDGITVLRLNRPPANAFCLELARGFEGVWDLQAVQEAEALVLTGAGHFFSGGLDLKVVPTYSREQQRECVGVLNRVIGTLYATPIPVIGAINGHAVAGGLILALTTDYRIGPRTNAQFGLTEARVGIPFPAVPLIVLNAECGPQHVRYSTLWARTFGAEEAQRRGVLDELQPPQALLERAFDVARDMASMPSDAYRRVKHQVREAAIARIQDVISMGDDPMLEAWLSAEAEEASLRILDSAS